MVNAMDGRGRKLKPFGKHVLCQIVEMNERYGSIIVPKKFQQRFGNLRSGIGHVLCLILDVGPDATKELEAGQYVLVNGLNLNRVTDPEFKKQNLCLPIDRAILVRFLQKPSGVD